MNKPALNLVNCFHPFLASNEARLRQYKDNPSDTLVDGYYRSLGLLRWILQQWEEQKVFYPGSLISCLEGLYTHLGDMDSSLKELLDLTGCYEGCSLWIPAPDAERGIRDQSIFVDFRRGGHAVGAPKDGGVRHTEVSALVAPPKSMEFWHDKWVVFLPEYATPGEMIIGVLDEMELEDPRSKGFNFDNPFQRMLQGEDLPQAFADAYEFLGCAKATAELTEGVSADQVGRVSANTYTRARFASVVLRALGPTADGPEQYRGLADKYLDLFPKLRIPVPGRRTRFRIDLDELERMVEERQELNLTWSDFAASL